ncbi:MAG: hypothetical protein WDA00_00125 [Eubacteriales bacterium]
MAQKKKPTAEAKNSLFRLGALILALLMLLGTLSAALYYILQ